jgi:group I intron endonuclease
MESKDRREFKLYVLKCPISKEIRYVGITYRKLYSRLSQHKNEAKKRTNTHKTAWIRGLLNRGHTPIIELVESFASLSDCKSAEIALIADLRHVGNLTNISEGGEGANGIKLSPEQKKKRAEWHRSLNRRITEDHREIIMNVWSNNQFAKGSKRSEEFKREMANIRSIPVIGIKSNTSISFRSCTQAAKELKISLKGINNALRGRATISGGYRWVYLNENKN